MKKKTQDVQQAQWYKHENNSLQVFTRVPEIFMPQLLSIWKVDFILFPSNQGSSLLKASLKKACLFRYHNSVCWNGLTTTDEQVTQPFLGEARGHCGSHYVAGGARGS